MNLVINEQEIRKDTLANLTYKKLSVIVDDDDAFLYYPCLFEGGETSADKIEAKLLLLSPKYGLYVFDTESNGEINPDVEDRLDMLYAEMTNRMLRFSELKAGRGRVKYDVHTILVGAVGFGDGGDDQLVQCQIDDLPELLMVCRLQESIPEEAFNTIRAALSGSAGLKQKKERGSQRKDSMGGILTDIENHLASFDIEQTQAYAIDVDLHQRIRGLAGSGKTIILTYKAAKYHAEHPDENILYTYYTKALGGSIHDGIERAFRTFGRNRKVDWSKITICHGWGSSSYEGVYSKACAENGYVPIAFKEAAMMAGKKNAFAYACSKLMEKALEPQYDLILIDEGQDFPKEFYQLCYRLCRSNRICWAYDEFQNIFDTTIQNERDTFGYDAEGKPFVDFGENYNGVQDIALKKCYRTPRISLISAFSLGLGIYNKKVLQRLESNQQWEALGFEVMEGDSKTGSKMVIRRPEENTPSYSNEKFNVDSLHCYKFGTFSDECMAVAKMIENYIKKEECLPTDVCVICIDRKNVASYLSHISILLNNMKIPSYMLLDSSTTDFFKEGHVTLSTVNKAKGNECGVVIICGVDAVFTNPDNVVMRDMLFTSMTRTKGWLTLTGCSESMDLLVAEYKVLRDHNYELHFNQPAKQDTKNIINVSRAATKFQEKFLEELGKLRQTGIGEDEIKRIVSQLTELVNGGKE